MDEHTQSQFDEVDLSEYIKVILRHSFFIIAIAALGAVAAFAFSMVSQKVYRVTSVLQVGILVDGSQGKPIESPVQISEKVGNDVYGISIREELGMPDSEYPRVWAEFSKDTRILKIIAEGEDAKKTKEVADALARRIIADHEKKAGFQRDLVSKAIAVNQKNTLLLKGEKARVQAKINVLHDEQDILTDKVKALQSVFEHEQTIGAQYALLNAKEQLVQKRQEIEDRYLEISSLDKQVNSLEQENHKLENSIQEAEMTAVIKAPLVPSAPVFPKTKVNIAVGAFAGFMAGIFFAFIREWWQKSSRA